MQNLRVWLTMLALLGVLGCRTGRQELPETPPPAAPKDEVGFTVLIHSDPEGAEVFAPRPAGGEQRLGTTPLTLTATMRRGSGRLFRKGDWQFELPQDSPLVFSSDRDSITLAVPELNLRKNGYAPERLTASWVVPASLRRRVSPWRLAPAATHFQKGVVFRTPTSARASTTVTIDCATGAARILALDAKGKAGAPVGTTPLVCRIGYAPERTDFGKIVNWRVWVDKHQDLWKVAPNGDLVLNAILERDGYAPEKVRRTVCNFGDPPPAVQTAQFQMIRPTQPEARIKLSLNSLPPDASVYVLNADGSLGREFGKTPLEIAVGVAQESVEETPGMYVHKDWRLWAPVGLVRWDVLNNGALALKLTCAVYKDGFAVEKVIQPIFELRPGKPFPLDQALTVPLLSPEQAAVRESHRLQAPRSPSQANDSAPPQVGLPGSGRHRRALNPSVRRRARRTKVRPGRRRAGAGGAGSGTATAAARTTSRLFLRATRRRWRVWRRCRPLTTSPTPRPI